MTAMVLGSDGSAGSAWPGLATTTTSCGLATQKRQPAPAMARTFARLAVIALHTLGVRALDVHAPQALSAALDGTRDPRDRLEIIEPPLASPLPTEAKDKSETADAELARWAKKFKNRTFPARSGSGPRPNHSVDSGPA